MLSTEVYDRRMNQITNIALPDRRISALMRYAESHGLRCKQVDGQWHLYKDGAQGSDHIQAYKQPAYSLLVPRKLLRKRKEAMTKFKTCEVCGTWVATHEAYGLQICMKMMQRTHTKAKKGKRQ